MGGAGAPGGHLASALAALYARVPLGMRLGLDAMRSACARAGHPERAFEAVHVAGTNGKGSTCAMIEAAARAAGTRTGLYTSPHLCRFAERIRIDGEPVDDEQLTGALARALEIGPDLSFFEAATLAAMLAFRDAGVSLAIFEVGIGGRLDATNVLPPPRCAAVTRIALDHTDRLGDTLEAIAREKAAIAKPGSPIVLGPMAPGVLAAARDVASSAGARVLVEGDALPSDAEIGLGGAHQRDNARVAWRVCEQLGIDVGARLAGFRSARWPGRFEHVRVAAGPLAGPWILDGAHNPDGAEALARALAGAEVGAMVFGALADKAYDAILDALASVVCPRVFVAPRGRAPADPRALAARRGGAAATSLREALVTARRLAARPQAAAHATTSATELPVLVCGSIYLVGEARAHLLDLPQDPPVAL